MTTMLPDLQAAVLCEDVRAELSGQHSIVGIIAGIAAPVLPIGFLKLCLWSRWCGGVGSFTQRSVIVSCDEETPINEAVINFDLNEVEAQATNVHIFGGVQFQKYGVYHVEIYLGEALRMRFPLPVIQVSMPQA